MQFPGADTSLHPVPSKNIGRPLMATDPPHVPGSRDRWLFYDLEKHLK